MSWFCGGLEKRSGGGGGGIFVFIPKSCSHDEVFVFFIFSKHQPVCHCVFISGLLGKWASTSAARNLCHWLIRWHRSLVESWWVEVCRNQSWCFFFFCFFFHNHTFCQDNFLGAWKVEFVLPNPRRSQSLSYTCICILIKCSPSVPQPGLSYDYTSLDLRPRSPPPPTPSLSHFCSLLHCLPSPKHACQLSLCEHLTYVVFAPVCIAGGNDSSSMFRNIYSKVFISALSSKWALGGNGFFKESKLVTCVVMTAQTLEWSVNEEVELLNLN